MKTTSDKWTEDNINMLKRSSIFLTEHKSKSKKTATGLGIHGFGTFKLTSLDDVDAMKRQALFNLAKSLGYKKGFVTSTKSDLRDFIEEHKQKIVDVLSLGNGNSFDVHRQKTRGKYGRATIPLLYSKLKKQFAQWDETEEKKSATDIAALLNELILRGETTKAYAREDARTQCCSDINR